MVIASLTSHTPPFSVLGVDCVNGRRPRCTPVSDKEDLFPVPLPVNLGPFSGRDTLSGLSQ